MCIRQSFYPLTVLPVIFVYSKDLCICAVYKTYLLNEYLISPQVCIDIMEFCCEFISTCTQFWIKPCFSSHNTNSKNWSLCAHYSDTTIHRASQIPWPNQRQCGQKLSLKFMCKILSKWLYLLKCVISIWCWPFHFCQKAGYIYGWFTHHHFNSSLKAHT